LIAKIMVNLSLIRWMHRQVRTRPALGRFAIRCLPDTKMHIGMPVIGRIQINVRRNRSLWLRDPLVTERLMFGALKRLIHSGDVVYDAGSNIGIYVRFMVSVFGAGAVVAFEPMPENLEVLRHNIEIGSIANKVRVVPIALSDADSDEEFQLDDMSSASATLSRVSSGNACQGRKQYGLPPLVAMVKTRALDSLAAVEKFAPPDVIKIDVEGAEGLVLSGARCTLMKHRPRLAIELHGIPCAQDVVRQLTGLGYYCYGFLTKNGATTYRRVHAEDVTDLRDQYDLERVFASFDHSDVSQPMEPFE
jgi:FkbM family methyltransferase